MHRMYQGNKWWAAHLLEGYRRIDNDTFVVDAPVIENIVLINASSHKDAYKLSLQIGHELYEQTDTVWTIDELRGLIIERDNLLGFSDRPIPDCLIGDTYISFLCMRKLSLCIHYTYRDIHYSIISSLHHKLLSIDDAQRLIDKTSELLHVCNVQGTIAERRIPVIRQSSRCLDDFVSGIGKYVVNIILLCDFSGMPDNTIVTEKIILLDAINIEHANNQANTIGLMYDGHTVKINNNKYTYRYIGISKNMELYLPNEESIITNGTEITELFYYFNKNSDLNKFILNEDVCYGYDE